MLTKEEIWWSTIDEIIGFEGEGDGGDGGAGGDGGTGDGGSGDAGGDGGTGDGGEGEEGEGKGEEDLTGLKRTVAQLRQEAKQAKADRAELKKLREAREAEEAKKRTDLENANAKAQKSEERATKLATRLRNQAVDILIEREARALRFYDVEDVLAQLDRSGIEVEQDDDDPTEVKINAKTVKAAVKALADKKKHLVRGEGDDDGGPSGSRFNGSKGGPKGLSEEKLKEMYPGLR